MKFYLIVARGKKKGLPIPIAVDLFLLGSEKMCQLRSHKPGIAPRHCALVVRGERVFVRDLDGGETTLLNGAVLPAGEEWPCHAGDRLALGPLEFIFQISEKSLSKRNLEDWALHCLDANASQDLREEEDDTLGMQVEYDNAAQAAASMLGRLQARRGQVHGRIRVGREGNVTTVRFADANLVEEAEIALLKKELYDSLCKNNLRVLLDLKNVKRLSTAAVTMIDEIHTWLKPWGSTLALCRVRPELQGILGQLSLHNRLPHFDDKKAALTAQW